MVRSRSGYSNNDTSNRLMTCVTRKEIQERKVKQKSSKEGKRKSAQSVKKYRIYSWLKNKSSQGGKRKCSHSIKEYRIYTGLQSKEYTTPK